MRYNDNSFWALVIGGKVEGENTLGRPPLRYMEQIMKDVNITTYTKRWKEKPLRKTNGTTTWPLIISTINIYLLNIRVNWPKQCKLLVPTGVVT